MTFTLIFNIYNHRNGTTVPSPEGKQRGKGKSEKKKGRKGQTLRLGKREREMKKIKRRDGECEERVGKRVG